MTRSTGLLSSPSTERYQRQASVLSDERRGQLALAFLGTPYAEWTARFTVAGAAAMGAPLVASDDASGPHRSWFLGMHAGLVHEINGADVRHELIDPVVVGPEVESLLLDHDNPWVIVSMNESAFAQEALSQLARLAWVRPRILLALCGPGGVLVVRAEGAQQAQEYLASIGILSVLEAAPELAMIAAGLCLNQMMTAAPPSPGETAPPLVGCHSLQPATARADRLTDAPLAALAAGVAASPGCQASFAGRHVLQVGGGGLGNFTAIPIALDGGVRLTVIDGDESIEEHNLNRQFMLCRGVGRAKAPVLTEELQQIDPAGTYESQVRFVREPVDLGPLSDADVLLAVPDNDVCRSVAAQAAWHADVLFGQAASSITGGQETVHLPGQACLGCVTGIGTEAIPVSPVTPSGGASCAHAASDAVVSSNLVSAGLLVSAVRQVLGGHRPQNTRFVADRRSGSPLERMVGSHFRCPHARDQQVPTD